MAQKPETRFKLKVYSRLKLIPGLYRVKIQQVAIRGTPDLMICFRGKFIAWELKVDDNKSDPLQKHELEKIRSSGGIAREVRPETLEEAIEELLCLKP